MYWLASCDTTAKTPASSIAFANAIATNGYEIFAEAAKKSDGIPTRRHETVLVYDFAPSKSFEKSTFEERVLARVSHIDIFFSDTDVSADQRLVVDNEPPAFASTRPILEGFLFTPNDLTSSQKHNIVNATVKRWSLKIIVTVVVFK
jgi:hypothetical protein